MMAYSRTRSPIILGLIINPNLVSSTMPVKALSLDFDVDPLLRARDVCTIVGLSHSQIYVMMADDAFPRPFRVTGKAVRWKLSTVKRWMASREIARPSSASEAA
jgi:predicted DNA-binding transcriptional regulator AlpA